MKQEIDTFTRDLVDEMEQRNNHFRHLEKQLENIRASLVNGLATIEDREAEKTEIEELGYVHASLHWKAGKYLYLIHRQKNGKRVREYVGANTQAIEEAKNRIARAQRYKQLELELQELNSRRKTIENYLNTAVKIASGFDPW